MCAVRVWPCGAVQEIEEAPYPWMSDDYVVVAEGAPHAALQDSSPTRLAEFLRIAGESQTSAAERLGISPRQMRRYLATEGTPAHTPAPYTVQFALEALARAKETRT